MELQPHTGGGKQGAGSHSELQPDGDGESKGNAPVCDESHPAIDYAVVNVDHLAEAIDVESSSSHQVAGAEDDDDKDWCARTPWSVGGGRAVRPPRHVQQVRLRFFHRNKRCFICRTYCFKVLVTKAAAGTTSVMPPLLWFAFWEGHVTGKYWYHRHSQAFFEDEEEYKAAKKACQGILYSPLMASVLFLFFCVNIAVFYGWTARIDEASRLRERVLSISIMLLVFTIFWTPFKCLRDPLHIETSRLADRQQTERWTCKGAVGCLACSEGAAATSQRQRAAVAVSLSCACSAAPSRGRLGEDKVTSEG